MMSGLSGNRLVSRTRTGDKENKTNDNERPAVAHDLAGIENVSLREPRRSQLSLQAVVQICGGPGMTRYVAPLTSRAPSAPDGDSLDRCIFPAAATTL